MASVLPEGLDKSLSDQNITTKVRVALRENEKTSPYLRQLKIGTLKREVYISGRVPSQEVKDAILDVAWRLGEVGSVKDLIEVGE